MEHSKKIGNEIIQILEKKLNDDDLSIDDIQNCRNICNIYENKLDIVRLTNKLIELSNKYSMSIKNPKIIYYDVIDNKGGVNGESKNYIMNAEIDLTECVLSVLYEIFEGYSDDRKQKYLFHSLRIDGYQIIKKENQTLVPPFINITYLEELVEKYKLNVSSHQFLEILARIFNIYVFREVINLTEKNPEKYRYNKDWESDSDISPFCSDEDINSENDINTENETLN